jgi:2-polyprenyl-6-hydroxyphenyl methylase/3-demethylubiquinone-9 3-methyltransferase
VRVAPEDRFAFGKNWSSFVDKNFDEERLAISQAHLLAFLGRDDLKGQTFLDIGCGSGIHSLAAWRAGAERVFSFDFDADSVSASRKLWRLAGEPDNWQIERGSVLDERYLRSLGEFDVVYSWGVLHHTGAMWKAVELASVPMRSDGCFYIALYSKDIYRDWERWVEIKRAYHHSGRLRRLWMEWCYAWDTTIRRDLWRLRNPLRTIRRFKRMRGMSYWVTIRDWVGGWPTEFAGDQETVDFCARLGLRLERMKTGEGNTEFLFRRAT